MVFDKTGVLTEGRPQLIERPGAVVLEQAAQLARATRHPLAQVLARAAGPGLVAGEAKETIGAGVEGLVGGRMARLGRATYLAVEDSSTSESELWFAFDGEPRHRFRFADTARADAAETIAALTARGLGVEILSGDVAAAVARIADETGVALWRAGMTPIQKSDAIDRLKAEGRKVLMVGDGLNDAAALSRAHASMAPGAAMDASQNAADLVFEGAGLMAVADAIDVARAARRRAVENFGFSALYNVVAAPAAIFGLVNPFVAALAMSGSSMVVTLNALRMNLVARRKARA